jgi:hypothetical protein
LRLDHLLLRLPFWLLLSVLCCLLLLLMMIPDLDLAVDWVVALEGH